MKRQTVRKNEFPRKKKKAKNREMPNWVKK